MDLTRFQRILRSRWLVLALVAVVSIGLANWLTQYRNEHRPRREAVAAISFFKQLGELDDEAAQKRVEDAATAAADANIADLKARLHPLAPWEIAEVQPDTQDLQLLFIGRADSDAAASAIAERLRQRYLADEPFTAVAEIDDQLHLVATKLSDLQDRISASTPDPEPTTTGDIIEARNEAALRAQVESLRESYNNNAITLLDTDLEPDEIDALLVDQDRLLTLLQQYEITLLSLQPPEAEQVLTEEGLQADLQVQLWQAEFDQLMTTYESLFQQKVEFENLNRIEPTETFPSSLEPVSPVNNQALALAAGLLVGAVGLLLIDRLRQPLWAARDIEGMTALPEIPPRGWLEPTDKAWYLGTGAGKRKAGIQVLRPTVENLQADGARTIGLSGIQTYAEDVQELSADLAVAMAISGSQVLLINADFAHQSHLYEIEPGTVTLAALIEAAPALAGGPDDAGPGIARALRQRPETVAGMRALPAGSTEADATDMLSRPGFTAILETAADAFDVVIVSGADANDPVTHVLSQRLDAMLLVGSAGHTTVTGLEVAKREFAGRRARLVGMTLLRRRPTRLRRLIVRQLRRRPRSDIEDSRTTSLGRRAGEPTDEQPSPDGATGTEAQRVPGGRSPKGPEAKPRTAEKTSKAAAAADGHTETGPAKPAERQGAQRGRSDKPAEKP
ncbi:MAG: hypothetical protein ACE5E8_05700 [Acidimicrobiia bacterium]